MDYLDKLLIYKAFNTCSFVVVASQIPLRVILFTIFQVMENSEPNIDFRCDAKLSDKDLTQRKCFDQYEEQYNKFSFPVYGFVLVNFFVILIVCLIYSLCVMPTVNKLEKSEGNVDAEGERTDDERASLITNRGPFKTLFMAYCLQLVLRFALGIFFIILQIVVLYPRSLPSNFVCKLGEEVNKPNSPANFTQSKTQTYKCYNQRATMKSHLIDVVAVLNGIFAFLVCIEIVYILFRALRNGEFMENKQFYSDHLRGILGSKRQPSSCRDVVDAPLQDNERQTPRKYRPKRSQIFLKTFEDVKKDQGLFRLIKGPSQQNRQSFQIQDSGVQKEYTVKVSTAPSCTCEDYNKSSGKDLCKHIIWVYLYVLHVEETSNLLQQVTLSKENVNEILFAKDDKSILSQDERNGQELQWYLLRREGETDLGENPPCTARRCPEREIRPGALCFKVKGLQVVNDQNLVEESLFYFCPSRDCIKQFPLNSNLKFPTKVFRGEGVSGSEIFNAPTDGYPQLKFV